VRNLFWILLLANVILFAVMQRGGFGWSESGIQAQPYLHSEMIRLIPGSQNISTTLLTSAGSAPISLLSAPVPVVKMPAPSPAPSSSASNLQLSLNMAAPSAAKPGTPICLEWSDFSGPDLVRAAAALSALQLADKLSQRQIERDIGYWVYIPPLRNKAAVNRKIAELKALGIREYFVMPNSGRWLNAISLGIFKTQEAAQNFHRHLQSKGVRSARVGERVGKLKATIFVLNAVDVATQTKLTAMQQDFAGSTLDPIPCALTR
jgi:hypothetical protein